MTVTALIADLTELAQFFGSHVEVVMPPRPMTMQETLDERAGTRSIEEVKYEQGKIWLR